MTQHPGGMLIVLGVILIVVGAVWMWGPVLPWLGRLPGDLSIRRDGFRFEFPLMTCLLVSLLLTAVAWIIRQLRQ